ncbi:MAG: peroxide stress protein YaaA [Mariprofundaceae bacterium]
MLIVISPAKKLDFEHPLQSPSFTQPDFLEQSQVLIEILRNMDSFEIANLMNISLKLADLNVDRYQCWHTPFAPDNARQAIFTFRGDVYQGLDADSLHEGDLDFAQQHLRILSGLYGLLRPLDLMQPYRLEMGTSLATDRGRNLYDFWGPMITASLNKALEAQGDDVLINLASHEYFRAIQPKQLNGRIITPVFKERKGDSYKVVGIHAKRARGLMSRYIIENHLSDPEAIKSFGHDDYAFNADLSTDDTWVLTRG